MEQTANNTKIKMKKSIISGVKPKPEDLDIGELAINAADGTIFMKKIDNTVVEVSLNA